MKDEEKRFDGVFEGGGVRGIALVGAYSVLEGQGFRPVNVAGTSAGAVVSALIAAGYTSSELYRILMELDFTEFLDCSALGGLPYAGPALSLFARLGLFKGDAFLRWMRELLAAKGKRTFADLMFPGETDPRYRFALRVVAADVSRQKLLVLPDDAIDFGAKPEDLSIAEAVRMSMSIPFFFCPVVRRTSTRDRTFHIVDGAILSNFPVEMFDCDGTPEWPTFGFHLFCRGATSERPRDPVRGVITMLRSLFETMLTARDSRYLDTHAFARTITIDTLGISAVAFGLNNHQKQALFDSGVEAAKDFLARWDFEKYKARYRSQQQPARRRDMVWAA